MFRLVDACYDEVKGRWEENFGRRYGFWRGCVEYTVYAFLDCGIFDRLVFVVVRIAHRKVVYRKSRRTRSLRRTWPFEPGR